jgi:hypothetical protein
MGIWEVSGLIINESTGYYDWVCWFALSAAKEILSAKSHSPLLLYPYFTFNFLPFLTFTFFYKFYGLRDNYKIVIYMSCDFDNSRNILAIRAWTHRKSCIIRTFPMKSLTFLQNICELLLDYMASYKLNSVALVRKRTIPTERPPLSAK